jgi:DNA-directed RNA polymerase subunit RPC12/RpoP
MNDMNEFLNSLSEDQKKKLLEALLPKQDESNPNKSVIGEDFRVFKTDNKLSNQRRKEPVRGKENKWRDTGEFRDVETEYGERTPRNREAPKKVEVDCHVCGRPFKMDKRFAFGEYHRCNRCGGKK